jgi:DNA-binding transcriptional LysR family regulator
MIQDTKMKVFLSLARTLSFTNTAKELFLSQQAVSKNIASLEERLGFPLFVRTSRSVTLTRAGERYNQALLEINRIYNEALIEIEHLNEREYRSFRVGYQNFLDLGAIPNLALQKLRAEHPDLSVDSARYSPLMLAERLQNGSCDLVVINGRFAPHGPGLRRLELLRSPQAVMISPENPLVTPNANYTRSFMSPSSWTPLKTRTRRNMSSGGSRRSGCGGSRPRRSSGRPTATPPIRWPNWGAASWSVRR